MGAKAATFDCLIAPHLRVNLAAPTEGVLEKVLVDRGDHVGKGDIVAKLDSAVEEAAAAVNKARAENEAAVASRSARVEFLKGQRERASQLQIRGAGTQVRLDQVESDLQVAEGELLQAQEERRIASLEYELSIAVLNQRSIPSPIDGIVVERMLTAGEYVYAMAPVMVIDQVDPLDVEAHLPTKYFGTIHAGMKATVRPAKPVSGEYQADVEVVDTVLDAQSGTFGVRLKLPNTGAQIPAGIRCEIDFPEVTPTSTP